MIANHTPWSRQEIATLRRTWPRGWDAACAALPGRLRWTVYQRARRLRLAPHCPRWTQAEKDRLVFLWGELRLSAIAKRMGHSQRGCYNMACKLGLQVGCPNGYEYLRQACRRTGYDAKQLRRILGAYDVRLHLRLSYFKGGRQPHREHYVDPDEVDRAVAAWVSSEPVAAAARRIGVTTARLRHWAITAGAGRQRVPGAGRRLTVEETLRAYVELAGRRTRRARNAMEAAA